MVDLAMRFEDDDVGSFAGKTQVQIYPQLKASNDAVSFRVIQTTQK